MKRCFALTLTLLLAAACLAATAASEAPRFIEPPSQVQADLKISLESIARERQFGILPEDEGVELSEGPALVVRLIVEDAKGLTFGDHYAVRNAVLNASGWDFLSCGFETTADAPWSFIDRRLSALIHGATSAAVDTALILQDQTVVSEEQAQVLAQRLASDHARARSAAENAERVLEPALAPCSLEISGEPCPPPGTTFDLCIKVDESRAAVTHFGFSRVQPGAASTRQAKAGLTVTIEKVRRFRFRGLDVFALWTSFTGSSDVEWDIGQLQANVTKGSDAGYWTRSWMVRPNRRFVLGAVDPKAEWVSVEFTATRRSGVREYVFDFKGLAVP